MKQTHRSILRIVFGVGLVLALCLRGYAASSNRPSRGVGRGPASNGPSRSQSAYYDDFLDLDNDVNLLFDDKEEIDNGLDGQDELDYLDVDYPEDEFDGIDVSEGGEDDYDEGVNNLMDDYAEDDGDGQHSSSTEKGALYDAYNLLHSLAQVSLTYCVDGTHAIKLMANMPSS